MGGEFLIDASSGVLGKEDRALAVGGGRARGTRVAVAVVRLCGERDWRR